MKKTIIFGVLVSVFLLAGCFWQNNPAQQTDQRQAAATQLDGSQTQTQQQAQTNTIQSSVKAPPSFQDGDYYLEALTTHSLELCAKIGNEKLRTRCETDVKGSASTNQ